MKNRSTAILIGVYGNSRDREICEDHLLELESLGKTYGLITTYKICFFVKKKDPATLIKRGAIDKILNILNESELFYVIFDDEISPTQQRNLEKELKKTVIDRTELILGVFDKHAKTKEAKIQISLAQARYQLPRLKRLWTHLERQRMKGGYLKGMGERQLEVDKRILKSEISKLKKRLKEIEKKRATQRKKRIREENLIFSIVGYTNSGKSTLLNALTKADVLVEDKLFSTLDTTTKRFILPNKQKILFIDTVGFIRKLPHDLIASFKSTLEEIVYSDVLINVIDLSDKNVFEKIESSLDVLKKLKVEDKPIIYVFNKIDKVKDHSLIKKLKERYPTSVKISALKKIGFDDFLKIIMDSIKFKIKKFKLKIPQNEVKLINELIEKGNITSKKYKDNYLFLEVEIPKTLFYKIERFII
ncbi:MAG: hypothetical protein AMS24_04965 [Chlamydiae bacterium SM23_39]|nr:MAG: hypothetical protein AMS24_04965 [Chlamydiae bacterium SM23_39]